MKRIAFVLLLLCLFAALSVCTAALGRATLYINDLPYASDSVSPFVEAEGRMLIPAVALEAFGTISVTASEELGSLLVSDGERYLSFNLAFGTRLDTEGNVKKCDIFRYGGELYLEPQELCDYFGITFESAFAPDGYLCARLKNSDATVDFETLLSSYTESAEGGLPHLYNPTGKTVAGSFLHPILIMPSPQNVLAAIGRLGENKVTFAILPSEIKQYTDIIPAIYASGSTLAYYMSAEADAATFVSQMESANLHLFSLVGKFCRIYVSPLPQDEVLHLDGYFAKSCLLHLVAGDLKNDRMIASAMVDAPKKDGYNFSIASDRSTQGHYAYFFRRLADYINLRSMPLFESSSAQ